MAVKVGINGFGRIGRNLFRSAAGDQEVEIVAVNDITDPKTLAHLLKYDSILGTFSGDVGYESGLLKIDNRSLKVFKTRDPSEIDWTSLGVEVVVESTGLFTKAEAAKKHLRGSVKKVIISAPATDPDITIVLGVNGQLYDPSKHNVISNASCTTNCLAPVAKVIHEEFGIINASMTTIHAYTNDQRTLDLHHSDLRRARAAAVSIIPTTTGAAKAVGLVLPELKGKIDGFAMRVPTPNVSLVDLVSFVQKTTTSEEVNEKLKLASLGPLKGIMEFTDRELVSVDFRGNPHSAIVDSGFTKVIDGTCIKVTAWYDNEWGYSCRVLDLIKFLSSKM